MWSGCHFWRNLTSLDQTEWQVGSVFRDYERSQIRAQNVSLQLNDSLLAREGWQIPIFNELPGEINRVFGRLLADVASLPLHGTLVESSSEKS
jgi:hypothetical protein